MLQLYCKISFANDDFPSRQVVGEMRYSGDLFYVFCHPYTRTYNYRKLA